MRVFTSVRVVRVPETGTRTRARTHIHTYTQTHIESEAKVSGSDRKNARAKKRHTGSCARANTPASVDAQHPP